MESAGRLNSWKEIAAHLGVSTRTAQRWERNEGLPARRHRHGVLSSVFAYASEIDAWWHGRPDLRLAAPDHQPADAPSIAVLPFLDLNRDEQNEILSDGLTEDLINALARMEGLQVVARTSAFHFKGRTGDIRKVGAQLGVRTVLEGSVRRAGDRLRVTAQLISAADGRHIWSERFDRRMTDPFDMQDEIACAIAGILQVKLGLSPAAKPDGRDLQAYELYLEGRYHGNRRTRAGFLRAVECFEQALARQERLAQAWAGLAECHAFLSPLAGIPAAEALPRAKAAARKALEIDDALPDAYCSLGFVEALIEYDWASAEGRFLRALELNPSHANAHVWYGGHVLAPVARLEEAAVHARRAAELDPLSGPAVSGLGGALLMLRRPEQAIAGCRRTLDIDPGYPIALRFLGEALLLQDKVGEAAEVFSKIAEPTVGAGFLGYCLARRGRVQEARQILQQLREQITRVSALQIAAVQLGLGDMDGVFQSLHLACTERCMGVHWLKVEPFWDPLRADPRFAGLLRELRLAA